MELLELKEQQIPGSAHYVIRRYSIPKFVNTEDKGMLVYHYSKSEPEENFFEMRFCITGNKYCSAKNCLVCAASSEENCRSHDTVDVFSFHFSANFLYQFVQNVKLTTRKDEVLAFSYPYSFSKLFPVCNRKRMTLDALLTNNFSGSL